MADVRATVYCATCRGHFTVNGNPPYSAIHVISEPPVHLHPLTRAVLEEAS